MTGSTALLQLYDDALPHVFGYLSRRCDSAATAEDLTSETFMAAVAAVNANTDVELTTAWLIGTARHKLIDHWRRVGRQRDALADLWSDLVVEDPSDQPVEVATAREVLAELTPTHRAALTLRYIDGLGVGQVADVLGRTIHATESLLTRAKTEFRHVHATHHGKEAS